MMISNHFRNFPRPGGSRRAPLALLLALVTLAGFTPIQAATTSPAAPPAATVTPASPPGTATLALLGDIILGRGVHPHAQTFSFIEPSLKSADLAMANLESPLTKAEVVTRSPYPLCAPPDRAHFLADAGFDLLSIANNHSVDCGSVGYFDTKTTIEQNGMQAIPIGLVPVYRVANGVKLAFLAINATSKINEQRLLGAITDAHNQGAVVIVSIHWGYEYHVEPTPYQRDLAQEMADAGASIIWGQHPHVLQPTEWIDVPCDLQNPAQICRKTLVLYSLGNALFDQYGLPDTRQSALIMLKVNQGGVVEMTPVPFVIDVPHSRLIAADAATAKIILDRLQPLQP